MKHLVKVSNELWKGTTNIDYQPVTKCKTLCKLFFFSLLLENTLFFQFIFYSVDFVGTQTLVFPSQASDCRTPSTTLTA